MPNARRTNERRKDETEARRKGDPLLATLSFGDGEGCFLHEAGAQTPRLYAQNAKHRPPVDQPSP